MKKFKNILVLSIVACLFLSACTVRPVDPSQNSGQQQGETTVKVSTAMFRDCYITLKSDVKSIGVSNKDGDKKKNYLVCFDSTGKIQSVVFYKKIEGGEDEEISYEQIEGSLSNFYITKDFIFLQYSSDYMSARNEANFVNIGSSSASFAVDIKTGKIYSMSQFTSFACVCDGVISAPTSMLTQESYYEYAVVNQELVFTDIVPNKTISVKDIVKDAHGNIYVVINNGLASRNGHVFYVNDFDYTMGSDGYLYSIATPSYYHFSKYYYGLSLYTLDHNGKKVAADNKRVIIQTSFITTKYYIFTGSFAYIVDNYRKSVDVFAAPPSNDYNMHYFPRDSWDFAAMDYPEGYATLPFVMDLFVVNNHVIAGVGSSHNQMDSVFSFDLSKIIVQWDGYSQYSFLNPTVIYPEMKLLTAASGLDETVGGLIATKNTATSNDHFEICASYNSVIAKKIASISYDTEILFVQPLN